MTKHFSLLSTAHSQRYYVDRQEAGRRLAKVLRVYKRESVVVLALPRGGVVLGAEVARELHCPLGVVLIRKIGHPFAPEYAIGAMTEDGDTLYNSIESSMMSESWLKQAESTARSLLAYRQSLYYGNDLKRPIVTGKTVLLVDDGIATGLSMEAAIQALKLKKPKKIIVAAPVASQESVDRLEKVANEVIVLDDPRDFLGAVGGHYRDFEQVDDDEVKALLRDAL